MNFATARIKNRREYILKSILNRTEPISKFVKSLSEETLYSERTIYLDIAALKKSKHNKSLFS